MLSGDSRRRHTEHSRRDTRTRSTTHHEQCRDETENPKGHHVSLPLEVFSDELLNYMFNWRQSVTGITPHAFDQSPLS